MKVNDDYFPVEDFWKFPEKDMKPEELFTKSVLPDTTIRNLRTLKPQFISAK
jgi:hypothetical protein